MKIEEMRFDNPSTYEPIADEMCYVRVRIDGRSMSVLRSIAEVRFAALAVRHQCKIGRIEKAVEDDNMMWFYARRVG